MGEFSMDDTISDFYVTLPSDASLEMFPENTQSSFRTKLSAPLMLTGDDWEVGLTEIFIPKTWYNVDKHNSAYSVTLDVEERMARVPEEHDIDILLDPNMNILEFCTKVNNEIIKHLKNENVKFQPQKDRVYIEIATGHEVHIPIESSPKMLAMLHYSAQNLNLTETKSFKYKSLTGPRTREKIKIVNKQIQSFREYLLSTKPIQSGEQYLQTGKQLADTLNENVRLLNLKDKIKFTYSSEKEEMYFEIDKEIKIHMDKKSAPTLMQKLGMNARERFDVLNNHTFQMDSKAQVKTGETMKIVVPVRYEDVKQVRKNIGFNLSPGMYKTSELFFSAFEHVNLSLLPNSKVVLRVLPNQELQLSKGLAEMLGFTKTGFTEGMYVSQYPLGIDAGITEIYVYSDLVSSHHVGDAFAPLLRVIPTRSVSSDEIVKHYDRPLYFPVNKKFIETIFIELRTGFGEKITFTAGKTHVVLSFRRKKL